MKRNVYARPKGRKWPKEGDTRFTLDLPTPWHQALRQEASERQCSMKEIVMDGLRTQMEVPD